MAKSLYEPIRNNFPLFIVTLLLNLQSTIFAYHHWNILNILLFGTISFFYSYTTVILCKTFNSKFLKIAIYIIGLFLCFTNIFLYLNFNTKISPNIIQLLVETNSQESLDFIGSFFINKISIYILLLTIIAIIVICTIERRKNFFLYFSEDKIVRISILCTIITGFFSFIFFYFTLFKCKSTIDIDEWVEKYEMRPMDNISNLVYSLYDIFLMKEEVNRAIKTTREMIAPSQTTADSLNIIFVIGESFNKYHSNLYGYFHNTNPILKEEKDNGRVFVFNNVISPYNTTSKVIRNMLCTNCVGEKERWSSFPFFPAIFKCAGYRVSFWDNQYNPLSRDEFDFSLNSFIHNEIIEKISYTETNSKIFKYDHQLIENFFRSHNSNASELNLVMIHLIGQHFAYYNRIPHDSSRFHYLNADSIKNNSFGLSSQQIIADYDNATRYNDYVLGLILNYYQTKDAVLIYLPDHGEEVYDYRNKFGRSWEKPIPHEVLKYQYEIPLIIWCSEKYKNSNPIIIDNIRNSLNKSFSSDNICHLLFSLAKIKTTYYKPERDLLNPLYKSPQRVINDILFLPQTNQ